MNEQTKPAAGPAQPLSAPMPAKGSFMPLRQVKTLDDAFRNHEFMDRIKESVPDHVKPERMMRTFIMATSVNEGLREASLKSFLGACLTTSQLGLEPNTPLGESYLIPFKVNKWNPKTKEHEYVRTDVTFIPGYKGLLSLSYRTKQVISIHADVVWREDLTANPARFSFEYGTDAHLRHQPLHVPGDPEDETPVFAYAHAKLVDGQAFLVWPWEQVLRIRGMSQGYRSALSAKENAINKGWRVPASWTEAPWVKHRNAMAAKTMIRAISNVLPRSIELASAVHLDQVQDRRSVSWEAVLDAPTIEGRHDYIGAAVEAADQQQQGEQAEDERIEGGAGAVGATFTDRRPPAGNTAPPAGATPGPTPAGATAGATAKPASTTPGPSWGPPAFEAVLADAFGEISGEVFSDPIAYAEALVALWGEATVGPDAQAILEHNADGIEQARQYPDAAAVLDALANPPAPPLTFSPIAVREERGRPVWAGWVADIKQALATVPPQHMPDWLDAQRETIARSPVTQRPLAIRAIAMAMGSAGHTPPEWLASMQPPSRQAAKAAAEAAAPPVESTPPPPPAEPDPPAPPPDADMRWATGMKADIAAATSAQAVQLFIDTAAIRTKMVRLQRERPEIFADVQAAFQAGLARFPEPPPADDPDGPGGPQGGAL